ncbi:MAG TPA: DUF5017 domain-containing protein [Chitinophaga sp.]|uniref:DUF5017 domain-containing protein n=1 Tax=Chitinophaga sp. TaxID=1869181 RepID=UPI002BA69AC4|nr:DUF5017 domain-containing protein [Chitinophaga sp.]HVI44811.1 DUF5017 domain-containing protein [Chitinophaga sp.]
MKKSVHIIFYAGLLLGLACKRNDVATPSFEVTTAKAVYKAGDSVIFSITGNPDFLIFFSGEQGKKYENVQRTTAQGKPVMSFETSAQNGSQVKSLSLMVSNNFGGVYNADAVSRAQWTELTGRAVMSVGAADVKSGDIDLSDFAAAPNTWIAFRFTGRQSSTEPQRQWIIKNFVLNNVLTDGSMVPLFANISASGWIAVDLKNPDVKWATPTATQLQINGGPAKTPDNDDWIISSAVNLRAVKPDVGVSIKDMTVRQNSYAYRYVTPGTYTVTFVGATNNVNGKKEVVKQLQLKIE